MAANPGGWGNNLQVCVTAGDSVFILSVRENGVAGGEVFAGLTMNPASPQYAIRVVNESSQLIRLSDEGSGEFPSAEDGWQSLQDGSDGDLSDSSSFAAALRDGIRALDALTQSHVDLMCFPSAPELGVHTASVYSDAIAYCEQSGIFLIIDLPKSVALVDDLVAWIAENDGLRNKNAAVYFPRTLVVDPLGNGDLRNIACSGSVLGLYARTDASRGVWRAPSGTDALLVGVTLPIRLTDRENVAVSSLGVNALRTFPNTGPVSWGSRTLEGADLLASEWRYIPVRRMALFLERSLNEGSSWIMFESNGEALWSKIRLSFRKFLGDLFLQGAFEGTTPRDAYFVKCDSETTSQADIDAGIVNIVVGFAPSKPAEFVVIRMQRITGEVAA